MSQARNEIAEAQQDALWSSCTIRTRKMGWYMKWWFDSYLLKMYLEQLSYSTFLTNCASCGIFKIKIFLSNLFFKYSNIIIGNASLCWTSSSRNSNLRKYLKTGFFDLYVYDLKFLILPKIKAIKPKVTLTIGVFFWLSFNLDVYCIWEELILSIPVLLN